MSTEQYIDNLYFQIKQWDLRQRKVVVEFQGHNEYSRTPFHIDTTETIISSGTLFKIHVCFFNQTR